MVGKHNMLLRTSIRIWDRSLIICMKMIPMTSFANHKNYIPSSIWRLSISRLRLVGALLVQVSLLGDLQENNFQDNVVAKAFLGKPTESRTVSTEWLIELFSLVNLL